MLYIRKCDECHHEWEGTQNQPKVCNWCGCSTSKILSESNPGSIERIYDIINSHKEK